MKKEAIKHLWQAEEYHQNSHVQNQAATQLLQELQLEGNECILDIGCGDGKITAKIASFVPEGTVLGIDLSSEMIGFAQQKFNNQVHNNLTFLVKNAEHLEFFEEFDIIFSSFAIQWIQNLSHFFKTVYRSLKFSGYVAATIPLSFSTALETAIDNVMSMSAWNYYFLHIKKWSFRGADEFAQQLILNQFALEKFSVIEQKIVFSDRDAFEKYVIQWFPYFYPLPDQLKQPFFNQVIDKYLEIEPLISEEKVLFKFHRLDFIAKKPIP